MKKEYETLSDMLARIRESFNEGDFIDNEGHDRLSGCIGSPVEVLAVMEIKMQRYEEALKFYATESNHESPIWDEYGQYNGSQVDKDSGEKARKALGINLTI